MESLFSHNEEVMSAKLFDTALSIASSTSNEPFSTELTELTVSETTAVETLLSHKGSS